MLQEQELINHSSLATELLESDSMVVDNPNHHIEVAVQTMQFNIKYSNTPITLVSVMCDQ